MPIEFDDVPGQPVVSLVRLRDPAARCSGSDGSNSNNKNNNNYYYYYYYKYKSDNYHYTTTTTIIRPSLHYLLSRFPSLDSQDSIPLFQRGQRWANETHDLGFIPMVNIQRPMETHHF